MRSGRAWWWSLGSRVPLLRSSGQAGGPPHIRLALLAAGAIVFSSFLYKYTLRAWFQQDDFAWLGLGLQDETLRDFLHTMFAPMAQGTIRPISERAFYMAFFSLFDLNALPYRLMVYVTQLGNIVLLTVVAWTLTKSYTASFIAPVLWTANIALAMPMTWTAAYNEILCSSIFLLSFYALRRYTETADWRFNALQWASFLIGFGVLEINVVYPLLAMLYTGLFAPKFLKTIWWLLLPSLLFGVIHTAVQTQPRNSVYALHVDASMFATLLTYWQHALATPLVLTILVSLAIVGFTISRSLSGDRLPLFFLGWFLITLAPFLPLRNHISDYYLTVPVIGLALSGAWAIAVSLKNRIVYTVIAGLAVAAYLMYSVPATRKLSRYVWSRSVPVKRLVLSVEAAHRDHPNKAILLEGVNEELFWNAIYGRPFRLLDIDDVYLTPDTVQKIPPYPELGNVADFTLSEAEMRSGLAQSRIVVYGVENGQLRDITGLFKETTLQTRVPQSIQLGHPPMESLLGPSWYQGEGDHRWMPRMATARLGVPESGEGELRIEATCAPAQVATQPLMLQVSVEGNRFVPIEIRDCNQVLHFSFPIKVPPGKKEIEVALEVDRTIRIGSDQRDLGMAVRSIEVAGRP